MKKKLPALLALVVISICCMVLLNCCQGTEDGGRETAEVSAGATTAGESATPTTAPTDRREGEEEKLTPGPEEDAPGPEEDTPPAEQEGEEGEEPPSAADLLGHWSCRADVGEKIKGYLKLWLSITVGEPLEGAELDTGKLKAVFLLDLSLNADGTCAAAISEEHPGDLGNSVLDMLLEAQVAEAETLFDPDQLRLDRETWSGYYVIEGDKLYLLEQKTDELSGGYWAKFRLEGDELVVTGVGGDMQGFRSVVNSLLPVTFTRA